MGKTHDDDEVEIDLRELFYALKKRILVILAAILAGAVIAGAVTKLFITPVYSATATMLVLTKETTLSSLAASADWQSADERLQHPDHKPYSIAGRSR